ncbi:sodium:solute symporter family protein [Oscillospiraceae bacterium 50-58]
MELTIIALYLVAIFGVGIYCNKFNNNIDDYLLAGRRLGIGLTTFTLVATYFGGGYVIGVGGEAFNNGLSAYWSPIAGAVGILAVCLILKRMEGMKVCTVTEIMENRYNSPMLRLLTTILSLLALVGILAGQVTSAGSVLASLGVGSTTTCAIIVAVFFIGFTAFGGLWAVTVTDFIQIIIAGLGLIAATIFVVVKGGGWDVISAQIQATDVPDNYFSLLQGTEPSYVLWLILPMFIYTLIGQDVYQRLFAAKDTKTAYKSAILAFIILLVICFFPVILGMAGRALFPDLEVSSLVVPTIIRAMLPPVFSGFTLAAIIAAVVSTADSILTAATSHVVNDLYVRYFCKDNMEDPAAQKKLLNISRVMTLVIGVISVVVALAIPSVLMVLNSSYTLFTAGVFSPVVAGLLWKKATKAGAFAGLFSGLAFVALGWSGFSFFGIPSDIASSLLSLVVLIVVSLITYKPESAS